MGGKRRGLDPGQPGRHPLARPQPLVGTEPPDLGDQAHQRGQLRLGRRVGERERRPGGHHHRVLAGQRAPQLVGDERHDRVQQPQHLVEHEPEHPARGLGPPARRPRSAAPWRAPGTSRRTRPRRSGTAPRKPCRTRTARAGRPPRRSRWTGGRGSTGRRSTQISWIDRARGRWSAPFISANLVAFQSLLQKFREPGRPVLADRLVAAGVRSAGQREPDRVGAEPVDPVKRVHRVPPGLGHLLAVLVADQAVQRDHPERHRVGRRRFRIAYSPNIIIRATQKNRMS